MKAVIFDMDGTLVDSKRIHLEAWQEVFEKHGYVLDMKKIESFFGQLDYYVFSDFFREKGIKDDPKRWCAERRDITVQKMKRAKLFPGAKQLLDCIPGDVKLALGTSSSRAEMDAVFDNHGMKKYFDVIMCREDVKKHKPHPELYLKIAKRLKVNPKDCVVVEDSIAGVEAAKRAGMFCIAVLYSFPAGELQKADVRVRSLKSSTIRRLLCRS